MSKASQPNHKPSVCFVALNAYNLLSGRKDISHIGGAEVQQVRIASWLVRQGYSVSFVTLDHGQPDGMNINGIRVFKAYAIEDGIRGLRFIYPRWSGLWAAMARANADVYYQRCAGSETGQVALWCYLHRRRFIFAAANDSDCDSSLFALRSRKEKVLYRVGLRLADAVTVQTTTQQYLLRHNMGISTVLVRNCGWSHSNCTSNEQPAIIDRNLIRVLWVGRFSKQKRLEWLLDVAGKCPDIQFHVVGSKNTDSSSYAAALIQRAAGISNVKMHGWVPYEEMAKLYQECDILCCTSAYEGFPNTFLEAWSLGIPVVSVFDPDGVIATNGLGFVAQDVGGIVTYLREIAQSPKILWKVSYAARQYYLTHHTPEICLPLLEGLILNIVGYFSRRCTNVGCIEESCTKSISSN